MHGGQSGGRVYRRIRERLPCHLASVVYIESHAVCSCTQRVKILEHSVPPKKCVHLGSCLNEKGEVTGGIRIGDRIRGSTNHNTSIIDTVSDTLISTKSS